MSDSSSRLEFTRKLQATQLDQLLSDLHDFFVNLPPHVRDTEEEIVSRINTAWMVDGRHDNGQKEVRNMSETVGNWLLGYFQCVVSSQLLNILTFVPVSDIDLSHSKS